MKTDRSQKNWDLMECVHSDGLAPTVQKPRTCTAHNHLSQGGELAGLSRRCPLVSSPRLKPTGKRKPWLLVFAHTNICTQARGSLCYPFEFDLYGVTFLFHGSEASGDVSNTLTNFISSLHIPSGLLPLLIYTKANYKKPKEST